MLIKANTTKSCYIGPQISPEQFIGKSLGSQQIWLKATKDGFTEISHYTIYKSGSRFRDTILYPFLHTKAIKAFHANIRNHLTKNLLPIVTV